MRGMPLRGHPLGGVARVPYMRPHLLLRFFRRQARDAALSRNGAPGHALGDARGCLDLVLRPRVRGPPRPSSENARSASSRRQITYAGVPTSLASCCWSSWLFAETSFSSTETGPVY